jgi:hypothetical protein
MEMTKSETSEYTISSVVIIIIIIIITALSGFCTGLFNSSILRNLRLCSENQKPVALNERFRQSQ